MPEPRTVAPAHLPSPAEVHVLQAVKEYPSVSLLMTTEPGAVLARADVLKLQALAAQATARVRGELSPTVTGPVLARLAELVEQASDGPATMSLAVYASASTGAVVRLPIAVSDRAVVDPTFATRDLVRALHRTPRHLVLALNSGAARLFDCIGDSLLPALTDDFPLTAKRRDSSVRGRADRPGRTADAAGEADFYRDVDDALGAYLRLHPAPLVLVGDPRATATFQRMSRNCQRLAGSVRGNLVNAPAPELSDRIRLVLADYLRGRQDEALQLVARRAGSGRVASGMPAAWTAAQCGVPEMLVVDESLYFPARLSVDGITLTPADDREGPDVIDDAVDELVELVLLRGGWITFASEGSLDDREGVALVSR